VIVTSMSNIRFSLVLPCLTFLIRPCGFLCIDTHRFLYAPLFVLDPTSANWHNCCYAEVLSSVSLNSNRFEQTCGGEFLVMDNEEAFLALTKENIYSFMACIFLREPDPVTWPEQSQALYDILREMGQNPERFGEIIPEQLNIHVENLRQEYFDCFFVPMSGKYVPPYESVLLNYKPEKTRPYGTLNSPEAHHVAQCYKATGFTPKKLDMFAPLKEIQFPDHAGFELAFMAMISRAEKEAWENQNHEEAVSWKEWGSRFLREHLVTWWPNFTLALEKMAPGYYAQVAKAVNIWILSELEESRNPIEEGRCRNLSS